MPAYVKVRHLINGFLATTLAGAEGWRFAFQAKQAPAPFGNVLQATHHSHYPRRNEPGSILPSKHVEMRIADGYAYFDGWPVRSSTL